ncbi:MAG: YbhB/YbcL family Raf kinase inhibitor-like protein [Bifidobacteriaceae bacterium]|jgi:Raf kinase inhibitor-like YbhB/YbcL family protein|nr:YbhB/YbcL family Raf kinase inhibitor-like protein [Bifidobacteriaceae bacterium]
MDFDPGRPYPPDPYTVLPRLPKFVLTCPDIEPGQEIPATFSAYEGDNVSPALVWLGQPEETKSFVVTCFDPDAPRPGGFWHWGIADIPPTVTQLPRGAAVPDGAWTVNNDGGTPGFTGMAPPKGDHAHRYFFAVHALDVPHLDAPRTATPAELSDAAQAHAIARAVFYGIYER